MINKIKSLVKEAQKIEMIAESLVIDRSDATLSELLRSHEALRTSLNLILIHFGEQDLALQRILSITLKNMEFES